VPVHAPPPELGATTTTNAEGTRAWILAAPEASALQQFFHTNSGANVVGSSAISTMHGGQARIMVGNFPPADPTGVGTTIDVLPRNSGGSIRIILNATAISKDSHTNASSVRTNFAVTCQALIPSGGCLLINGDQPKDQSAKSYWMVISPRQWNQTPINSKK
jgi:hypothetical protein